MVNIFREKKRTSSKMYLFAFACSVSVFFGWCFSISFMVIRLYNTDGGSQQHTDNINDNISRSNTFDVWEEITTHLNSIYLNSIADQHKEKYATAYPFKHTVIDDLIPQSVIDALLKEIPESLVGHNGCYTGSPRCKNNRDSSGNQYKKSNINKEEDFGPVTREVILFFQSNVFISFLKRLTGIHGLLPDTQLQGGGIHLTSTGGKLDIHADFNAYPGPKLDRRVNMFLFLNPDWDDEYGGHLELWNKDVTACGARIAPSLGRLVVFSTTDFSHHGHPHPLTAPEGRVRRSIALYFYTVGRPSEECLNAKCPIYVEGAKMKVHGTLWKEPVGCKKCQDCIRRSSQ